MTPNKERNARLAEWMGWRYDNDTTDFALALLGWLAEEPRGYHAIISTESKNACVMYIRPGYLFCPGLSAKIEGLPLVALPEAIARAAEKVLDLEEAEDG